MPRRPKLRPLPEPERRQSLAQFLTVLDQHPDLAHFRAAVPTGPERQLALFAALERSVFRGSAAVAPPSPDDPLDQLLCDILETIDRHPDLKNHGSYYGPDRHLANLQALGAWSGKPLAAELFTTAFSHLTCGTPGTLPASMPINSPASQEFSPNGELIAPASGADIASVGPEPSPQIIEGALIAPQAGEQSVARESAHARGIIHHGPAKAGEEFGDGPVDPQRIALRPLRRGRPLALDDLAKGRLLGMIAHGLSFRQAAAQLGVHHVTVLNLMKRDEEFAQQVAEARLDAISQPLLTVVQASRTNWRAAAWLAKFLDGRRASTYETTPEEHELARMRS